MTNLSKTIIVFLLFISHSFAQEKPALNVTFGTDLVSRYIWRGMDLGGNPSTPQFQPFVNFDFNFACSHTLTLGAWGSYGFTGSYSENDLSIKYTFYKEDFGTISASVIDFYFPFEKLDFFNYNNDGTGSHIVEMDLAYDGTPDFPIHLLVANNLINRVEGDKTLYAEMGYTVNINNYSIYFVVGGANGTSFWNQVNEKGFKLTNIGVTASKVVKISDTFSFPVWVSYVVNPHLKTSYVFAKVNLF
ncbi:MAG TPA: hypothetical protein PL041_00830 [Melioribacteraceae bacterium]|nr:hypothetical protein [Melioribacteraceae bacterium]